MASEGKQLNFAQKVYYFLAPNAAKDDDGRDNFNSRAEFVLAAMGGAVGLGNLLRFPSVIYNNYGLQFFIPYFVALFLIGIPILCLELCIGQAYRGGCVTAWNNLNHRARGVGFSMVFNGFSVVGYYVPLLAWAMTYFRLSFQSPLPWTGQDTEQFFYNEVVRNPFPSENEETGWIEYPGTGMVGETAGWTIFIWALVFMCMYKGVGLTGRAMWITMALPLIMIGILCIRSLSLPNASDGFRLYLGVWRTESLQGPGVWQDSFGQMFFSIGVGFGYFVTYASYSSKFSNSVQDAFIIALANSAIEIVSALAVMGVVGFLGFPNDAAKMSERLNTFSSGFFYYPLALSQLPGANFFSAVFFATLMLLGLTCAFALFEVLVTLIMDSTWGSKIPRHYVAMGVFVLSVCTSLIYCSEVGFFLLDAIDGFVNDLGLFFLVWCETYFATTLYRWRDPVDQIGLIPYVAYNGGYFLAHFIGLLVAHLVGAEAGAGVGFGIFIVGALVAIFLGKTPTVPAPSFWGKNPMLSRFWYAAFYSGQQLRKDLNRVVVTGKNWSLHWAWPVILKYITAPAVGIVFSFAYSKFRDNNMAKDPPYLYAFILFHMVMLFILVGILWPRFFSILIHEKRIDQGVYEVQPQVIVGKAPVRRRIDGDVEDVDSSVNDAPRTPDLVGETTTVTNEKSQL